jgi:hypothetical protein
LIKQKPLHEEEVLSTFQTAADFIMHHHDLFSAEQKLQFYGLYKQATRGSWQAEEDLIQNFADNESANEGAGGNGSHNGGAGDLGASGNAIPKTCIPGLKSGSKGSRVDDDLDELGEVDVTTGRHADKHGDESSLNISKENHNEVGGVGGVLGGNPQESSDGANSGARNRANSSNSVNSDGQNNAPLMARPSIGTSHEAATANRALSSFFSSLYESYRINSWSKMYRFFKALEQSYLGQMILSLRFKILPSLNPNYSSRGSTYSAPGHYFSNLFVRFVTFPKRFIVNLSNQFNPKFQATYLKEQAWRNSAIFTPLEAAAAYCMLLDQLRPEWKDDMGADGGGDDGGGGGLTLGHGGLLKCSQDVLADLVREDDTDVGKLNAFAADGDIDKLSDILNHHLDLYFERDTEMMNCFHWIADRGQVEACEMLLGKLERVCSSGNLAGLDAGRALEGKEGEGGKFNLGSIK